MRAFPSPTPSSSRQPTHPAAVQAVRPTPAPSQPTPPPTLRVQHDDLDDSPWLEPENWSAGDIHRRIRSGRYAAKRRRTFDSDRNDKVARQTGTDFPTCNDVGNYVYSCYPTSNTTVNQGDWTRLIWNPAVPSFMGAAVTNPLDIYLFHADSDVQVANWTNVPAATGHQSVQVADSFWGNQGAQFTGGQEPYPMYFVITLSGSTLNGAESRLATWTALQTALPASVISASSASVRSQAASASLSSVAATATRTPNPNLQGSGGGSSSDFPAWAIALVVVLGVLAAVALALLAYLLVRNIREKSRLAAAAVHRDSIHSASPMMANADMSHVQSPQSPTGPHEGYVGGGGSSAAHGHPGSIHRPGGVANDGASTVSESGPFSGADAMIMADAFRQALRKPDFAGRQEEGESPDTGDTGAEVARKELINRELAEEGRDIMSVSSGRGVTVGTGREEAPT